MTYNRADAPKNDSCEFKWSANISSVFGSLQMAQISMH